METKYILLIFNNSNSLKYWFRYLCKFLDKQEIFFKNYLYADKILVKNTEIQFVSRGNKSKIENYEKGRRNIKKIYEAEYELEDNFKNIFQEILNG